MEGYATGATVHEAVGGLVVIAFHAGNLKPVAVAIGQQYPDATIVIVADNDRWTEGNPGVTKAKEAAESIGAMIVIPEFRNTNDQAN